MNVINTQKAPGAIGPYSQAYEVNGVVYTSGQIPVNPTNGSTPADIAAQAKQSCENVKAILVEAGSSMEKVFKTTCFLADMQILQHSMRFMQNILLQNQQEAVLP